MSAHTPGPWVVDHLNGAPIVSEEETLIDIATIKTVGAYGTQAEANAKLIAAAPWLLAECQAARRALQAIFDSGTEWYDDGQGDHRSIEVHIGTLEAAIDKATS